MSQVFGIDPKHVEGEKRLGRAIRRILADKVTLGDGRYVVEGAHMEKLQRAFDKTFQKPILTPTQRQIMRAFRKHR